MKTLFKILSPTISTIGIATISLTSCGTTSADGYTAIPRQYLNIEGTTLNGLTEEGKYPGPAKQYDKLTVPKEITTVKGFNAFDEKSTPGYNNIKKIDFESDSKCTTINDECFSSLANLLIVILPPKLTNMGFHAIFKCQKLTTIDISNVEDVTCLATIEWIEFNEISTKGTLTINHSQKDKVKAIKTLNPDLINFDVKEK